MSLQGTLDTFALADVLELIERSRKSGALEIRDSRSRGVVYFASGRFIAAETQEFVGPVESAEELEARLIDVCFALFRVESGLFEFAGDRSPPWPVRGGLEVAGTVAKVQQLIADWQAIEAVIPSLDCRPDVVDDLGADRVMLDKAGFRVLRVLNGERTVREVARAVGQSVLEVGRVLHDLVEAGAVFVPNAAGTAAVDEVVLGPEPTEPTEPAAPGPSGYPVEPDLGGLVVPSSPEELAPFESLVAGTRPTPTDRPTTTTEPPVHGLFAPAHTAPPLPAPPERTELSTPPPAEAPAEPTVERPPDERPSDEPPSDEPPPDRGALLRMFSSLRDS